MKMKNGVHEKKTIKGIKMFFKNISVNNDDSIERFIVFQLFPNCFHIVSMIQ